jgi:hypothetical protein
MSTKYSGGIITKNPVTPAGPYETGAAPGVWTVEQALQYTKQGIWPTQGNVPNYIEDVFSTYLYSGTNAAQTITNGINLSGKGGLIWQKQRTTAIQHRLFSTALALGDELASNTTGAVTNAGNVTAYSSTGFSIGSNISDVGENYVTWTFRKQPKFFDVVTWTGDGTTSRVIPHNLGVTPGCIISKVTSTTGDWRVVTPAVNSQVEPNKALYLNASLAEFDSYIWSAFSSTSITISSSSANQANASGATYVAYLFASNAGGFGLTGTDNVISCGSFTTDGSGAASVTLGYEPQWILIKSTNFADSWLMYDNMRGMPVSSTSAQLYANTTAAESAGFRIVSPTATGFSIPSTGNFGNNNTFVYIVLRRGPMKVPTSGTSVFSPTANAGTGSQKTVTTNFPVDLTINSALSAATHVFTDRLRGGGVNLSPRLYSQFTDAETNTSSGRGILFDSNTGFTLTSNYINASGDNYIYYGIKRAPSFFDEVCYTGTGVARTVAHNLAAVPELMIVKVRSTVEDWYVYAAPLGNTKYIFLDAASPEQVDSRLWNNTTPTSSVFTVGTYGGVNSSGATFVAYLFATCAGVSKVGSYTGTGAAQTINCGFTAGVRFVLIKRTDSTGDWYVWDSARGIIPANDPYLLLNSTAAEVTGTDYIDTTSVGFDVTSTAPAAINANGGTFIFLAIA